MRFAQLHRILLPDWSIFFGSTFRNNSEKSGLVLGIGKCALFNEKTSLLPNAFEKSSGLFFGHHLEFFGVFGASHTALQEKENGSLAMIMIFNLLHFTL